jgi:D-alanine-D-alanine ligase
MKVKKCCILFNEPGKDALTDELDVLYQVDFIEKHLKDIGISTYRKGISINFMDEIKSLTNEKPDFVFNLVESIGNKGELSYFIPALLNLYSIPYTGCPLEALFITGNKVLAGNTMRSSGISMPQSYLPSQAGLLLPGKKYIIKPIWEDGSMGITVDSVFDHKINETERFAMLDDSHWFIEDYIDGREFNISVLCNSSGTEVLPPAEIVFRNFADNKPKIVDYKAKWDLDSFEYKNTVREFPGKYLEAELKEKLTETVLKCWNIFGLKGYARVDIRTDSNNNVYVLEVNANPCISPDSGFVAATIEAGYSFHEVIERIIKNLNNNDTDIKRNRA